MPDHPHQADAYDAQLPRREDFDEPDDYVVVPAQMSDGQIALRDAAHAPRELVITLPLLLSTCARLLEDAHSIRAFGDVGAVSLELQARAVLEAALDEANAVAGYGNEKDLAAENPEFFGMIERARAAKAKGGAQ